MFDAFSSLRTPPGIEWARDSGGTLVLLPGKAKSIWLPDSEQIVWDWISTGISYTHICRLLASLNSLAEAEAEEALDSVLRAWLAAGLFIVEGSAHG